MLPWPVAFFTERVPARLAPALPERLGRVPRAEAQARHSEAPAPWLLAVRPAPSRRSGLEPLVPVPQERRVPWHLPAAVARWSRQVRAPQPFPEADRKSVV